MSNIESVTWNDHVLLPHPSPYWLEVSKMLFDPCPGVYAVVEKGASVGRICDNSHLKIIEWLYRLDQMREIDIDQHFQIS